MRQGCENLAKSGLSRYISETVRCSFTQLLANSKSTSLIRNLQSDFKLEAELRKFAKNSRKRHRVAEVWTLLYDIEVADSESDIGFTTESRLMPQWHMHGENFTKMALNVLSVKFEHFYRKSGSVSPNLMSDLSPKVQIQRNLN